MSKSRPASAKMAVAHYRVFIFVLAVAEIANVNLLGWVVTTSVRNDIGKALGTVSKSYASLGGFGA